MKNLEVGNKVRYQPKHYVDKFENGIVKEIVSVDSIRVVYNCANDWGNYMNYTSALTNVKDLKIGWL